MTVSPRPFDHAHVAVYTANMTDALEPWRALSAEQRLIESVVFLFMQADESAGLGSAQLRGIMQRQMADIMPTPPRVDLQQLWNVMATQPVFHVERAYGPLCRLKELEGFLAMQVALPVEVTALSEADRARHARTCPVKEKHLTEVLNQVFKSGQPAPDVPKIRRDAPAGPRELALSVAMGVAALGALGGAYMYVTAPGGDAVDAAELRFPFRVSDARRYGGAISATLADTSWLAQPEAERREALQKALTAQPGATALVLRDARGAVVALATADNGKVHVEFPR